MAQADSSRFQLASMKEASWGVIPGTVTLKEKRITREALRYNKRTVASQELRSDRQVPDLVQVGVDAQGEVGFELSYGAFDDWLLSALCATDTDWTTPFSKTGAGSAGDIQFTAPSTIACASATFTPLRVGQYIRVASATNPANNGIFKIATVAATTLTVVETTLANENSSTATITGSMIRNGTTEHSFLLEKKFGDIDEYDAFPGMEIGQLSLDVRTEQIMTGSFTWNGKYAVAATNTLDTAGGYDAATTADVMNATANVGTIQKNGSALATFLQSIQLQVNNNLRNKLAIGNNYAIGIGRGVVAVTGTITAYFEDLVLLNHIRNHDAISLHFRVADAAGNTYLITMPRIRATGGDPNAGGQNQDVVIPFGFQAVRDPTTGCTIQLDKL